MGSFKTILMYALILLIVITAEASAQSINVQREVQTQHMQEAIAQPTNQQMTVPTLLSLDM